MKYKGTCYYLQDGSISLVESTPDETTEVIDYSL